MKYSAEPMTLQSLQETIIPSGMRLSNAFCEDTLHPVVTVLRGDAVTPTKCKAAILRHWYLNTGPDTHPVFTQLVHLFIRLLMIQQALTETFLF